MTPPALARELGTRDVRPNLGRIVQVGVSTTSVCGVRDNATVLEAAFSKREIVASTVWCELRGPRIRDDYKRILSWLLRVHDEIKSIRADAVLLHYSAFAFGPRGVPIFAPRVARELGTADVPVLGLLHEFAYPFDPYPLDRGGWRGGVQAVSQRLALWPIVRHCDAAIVTTEQRRTWLRTRWWLARRRVEFLPVPSNLPSVSTKAGTDGNDLVLGILGFASPGAAVEVVADAVSRLRKVHTDIALLFLGAPGADGPMADRWRQELEARACSDILGFTGVMEARRLALELARVDLVVFPDRSGPDSRRGTLAAALAAGKAVLALDGPETWRRMVSEGGVVIVPQDSIALADELIRFANDRRLRVEQEARAAHFYARMMAPDVVVEGLVELFGSVASTTSPLGAKAP
jgi:glycosyltransferase involved in cell wall biosynthesis